MPEPHRGTRVVIGRRTSRPLKRFQIVAIAGGGTNARGTEGSLQAKRIVGLPGEQIELRNGDLHVNGKIQRKSAEQFASLAVLVHDDRFRPRPLVPRWVASRLAPWKTDATGYSWSKEDSAGIDACWLDYRHVSTAAILTNPENANVILDEYPFNDVIPRTLNRVTDIAVSGTANWNGAGTVSVGLTIPGGAVEIRLKLDARAVQTVEIVLDGKCLQVARPTLVLEEQMAQLDFVIGHWDETLVVQLDEDAVVRAEMPPRDQAGRPHAAVPSTPTTLGRQDDSKGWPELIGIRCEQMASMQLSSLRVWRDIYYSARSDLDRVSFPRLKENHYLVLGDNVPRSVDARSDPSLTAVPRSAILGVVYTR